MCGPSNTQNQLEAGQQQFFNQLMQSYSTNFGEQQGILSNINSALSPILQAGPNQQGFSAAENAALTGGAINSAAAANRNAQTIAGAEVGGNTGVTTGGQQQLQAQIASGVSQNLASNENQINLANYAQGRQNFFNAEQGLSGAAQIYNPTGYAGATNAAGGQAFNEATQINQESNQMEADIAGAVIGGAQNIGGSVMEGLSGGGGLKDVASSVLGGLF